MSDAAPPPAPDGRGDGPGSSRPPSPWARLSRQVRDHRSLAIGGAAALAAVLIAVIVFLAVRPATTSPPVSSATPAPTPTAVPTPSPSAQPSPSNSKQARQEYRDYVTVLVTDGTSLAAAMAQLQNCGRGDPARCERALAAVRAANATFAQNLSVTTPPSCLADADSQLHTGLGLQQKGLDVASQGLQQRNRIKVVQGAILFTASNWSITQAVRTGRQASC
ncbi:MAG: hypothetical protein LBJ87_14505 [bacterium]|jgi:hypothetical protein|nr:hypothetical protein [bacterium]